MPPLVQFIIRRLFYAVISLIVITMVLYAGVMLTPPEARAQLYIPRGKGGDRASENYVLGLITDIGLGARDVGSAVIFQATITFIGLGGASPWGALLSMGRNFVIGPGGSLLTHWWVFLPVTLAVVLFGVSWNLIGDGLNDILMPGSQTNVRFRSYASTLAEQDSQPAPA
jgi:hypothetical protein